MKLKVILAAVAVALVVASPVGAQGLKDLLLGSRAGASGSYKKNDVIKVKTTSSRTESPRVAADRALWELAEMTKAKGFPQFAITKQVCGTQMMSNIPVYHSCNVTAQMLTEGAQLTKVGKTKPTYVSVEAVLASPRL